MAIDPETVIEDALDTPQSVSNAAGESTSARPLADQIDMLEYLRGLQAQQQRKRPFRVIKLVPGSTVGNPAGSTE